MADRKLKPSEQRRIDQQQALLEAIRRSHGHRVEPANHHDSEPLAITPEAYFCSLE